MIIESWTLEKVFWAFLLILLIAFILFYTNLETKRETE